jgi:hypothetical protein
MLLRSVAGDQMLWSCKHTALDSTEDRRSSASASKQSGVADVRGRASHDAASYSVVGSAPLKSENSQSPLTWRSTVAEAGPTCDQPLRSRAGTASLKPE